jgi:hypothetical protein
MARSVATLSSRLRCPQRSMLVVMATSGTVIALPFLALLALQSCGDDTDTSAAAPAATGAAFVCPLRAPVVASALRSDATLISKQNQGCLYGQAPHSGVQARAASPTWPSAWIGLNGADAVAMRTARGRVPGTPELSARPDLAETAFQLTETTRAGVRMETTFTDQATDTWTVVVRLPRQAGALDQAREASDGLVDALNARAIVTKSD